MKTLKAIVILILVSVFTTTTYMTRTALNMSCRIGLLKREKRTFSVDDVSKTLAAWKTEYEIL